MPKGRPSKDKKSASTPRLGRLMAWLRSVDAARWGASILSGVMWFTACPPHPGWWWAWIATLPHLWAIEDVGPQKAFLLGWAGGFVMSLGGFWWLTDLFVRFGHLPWAAAFPITLLYSAYQGLIYALISVLYKVVRTRTPGWLALVLSVATVELLFPLVFPWYFSITQAYHPTVIQAAEFGGPIAVSVLLYAFSGLVWDALQTLRKKRLPAWHVAAGFVLLGTILGWSRWRIQTLRDEAAHARTVRVALIQTNIGINDGTRFFGQRQLVVNQVASRKAEELAGGLDLLVWSESSYPYFIPRDQETDFALPDGRPEARTIRRGFSTPLVMGAITVGRGGHYNSMLLWGRDGRRLGLYDKNWLLVFGEYIPLYDQLTFLHDFFSAHNMSNLTRGTSVHLLDPEGMRLGPMICYEDILTSYSRRLGTLSPSVLVNITNDAWFGPEVEPWQHMALAIYRTVETRRALVRTVNIGVSGIVSPWGELGHHAPSVRPTPPPEPNLFPSALRRRLEHATWTQVSEGVWRMDAWPWTYVVTGSVPLMEGEETFYVRFGDLLAWLAALAVAGLLIVDRLLPWWRRRRARTGTDG